MLFNVDHNAALLPGNDEAGQVRVGPCERPIIALDDVVLLELVEEVALLESKDGH